MHIINNGLYNPYDLLYHYHTLIIHFRNLFLGGDEEFPIELSIHSNRLKILFVISIFIKQRQHKVIRSFIYLYFFVRNITI